jgi:cell division initiation protein
MLTPRDLEKKQFTTAKWSKGYDQDEVDDFIDAVAADYTELLRRLQNEETRTNTPPHGMVTVENATRLLQAAEDAAKKCRAEAETEAELIVSKANGCAQGLLHDAQKEAEDIVRQGTEDRHKMIGELEDQRAQLKEKVDELIRAESDIVSRIRTALERWNA